MDLVLGEADIPPQVNGQSCFLGGQRRNEAILGRQGPKARLKMKGRKVDSYDS
jgi:hypothetical protein